MYLPRINLRASIFKTFLRASTSESVCADACLYCMNPVCIHKISKLRLLSHSINHAKEVQNVLYFLDETSGSWLPMPLNWERHVPNITSIIEKIQVNLSVQTSY